MKKLLALLLGMMVLLSLSAFAFAPPSPFPVKIEVIMGGGKVVDQPVTVKLVDGVTGSLITQEFYRTEGTGIVQIDLGNLKECSEQYRNEFGSCYAGRSRTYIGDNVQFSTVWDGQTYKVIETVDDLRLQIGVAVRDQPLWVVLEDVAAAPQIIEVEVEKIVEVIKTETVTETKTETQTIETIVYKCPDGSEEYDKDDCVDVGGVSTTVFFTSLALLGTILSYLGYSWHKGYLGLVRYWWNKGEKLRALRMTLTVIKRAKEEYYKKK